MADSVATPVIVNQWFDGKRLHVVGTISCSNNNYASGGIVCSFSGLGVQGSSLAPIWCDIKGIAGFTYRYKPSTTQANGTFMVFCENTVGTNTPLLEHTVTALVAGVQSDTITFTAIFGMGR